MVVGVASTVAFSLNRIGGQTAPPTAGRPSEVLLHATSGDNRKRKRRRKTVPGAVSPDPIKDAQEKIEGVDSEANDGDGLTKDDLLNVARVANFEFNPISEIAVGIEDEKVAQKTPENVIRLPDIKEAKKKKQTEEELARMAEEEEKSKVKIKRSDKEAFRRLLEQQPFADADDSFFEEEAYGTVSALLGERAKPFIGIPTGPLQVGHFVGALGLLLMAYVEYPGFPLTNLPTPLRDCLQGGLGTIYAINTVLAVLALFKAGERGQPKWLWIAKTFSVGGLAYDQLTQLPTIDEVAQAKSRKGARSLDSLKKKR
jgi:hypothetical protein